MDYDCMFDNSEWIWFARTNCIIKIEYITRYNVVCSLKTTRVTRNSHFLIFFDFHPFILHTLTHFTIHCHIHCIQCYSGCVCGEVVGGFTFTRHWNLSNDHWGTAANANPTRHLIVFALILDCIMGRHTSWVQEHNRWTRGQHQDLQDTLGSHFWGLGSYTQLFRVSVPGQLLREHLQIAS